MITLLHGEGVGAGKSYTLTTIAVAHLLNGGTVVTTDSFGLLWDNIKAFARDTHGIELEEGQLIIHPDKSAKSLHEVVPQGTEELPVLLILDEAHSEFNARDWSDVRKRAFFLWLTQSRHDDVDVIFSSQSIYNVDKQVQRLVTKVFSVRNMAFVKLFGVFAVRPNYFRLWEFGPDGKTCIARQWVKKNPEIYKCYVSKQCRGKHREISHVAEKRKLKRVKKKMNIKVIIAVILVLTVVLGGWVFRRYTNKYNAMRNPSRASASAPAVPVSPAAQSAIDSASPKAKPSFDMETERFRGGDGATWLRTAAGEYWVGEWGSHGKCISVRGKQAIFKQADGRLFILNASPSEQTTTTTTTTKTTNENQRNQSK